MLYIKIQPQSFLDSGEEDFLSFKCFTIYGHGGHLVHWRGTIRTNWQYPFPRRPHVKSSENCSSSFRDEDIKTLHNFVHVYRPGARTDNPQGKTFDNN